MTSTLTTSRTDRHPDTWDEPPGIAPRATVVVLAGRGETAAAYGRFGRRIAADAYRVRVVEVDLDDLDATRARVDALLTEPGLPAPRVLAGTDTGATYAALLAHDGLDVDGLVLAGLVLPGAGATDAQRWDDELETRTACPAHRRVLTEDASFERGALGRDLPSAWQGFRPGPTGHPTLVLHGSDDPLSPVGDVLAAYDGAPEVQLRVVEGGRHDVLNDVTHRSVAATVVLFLERLRLGTQLPAIVREVGGS